MKLTTEQRYRLAIEAGCHARTIHRWESGESINKAIRRGIESAAEKLNLVGFGPTPTEDERAAG